MADDNYFQIDVPGHGPVYFPKGTSQEDVAGAVAELRKQHNLPTSADETGDMPNVPAGMAASGGTAGALYGSALPGGPLTRAAGAATGGFIGATAGHYSGQMLQDQARGIPQTWDRTVHNLWEAAKNGSWSALAEVGGPALKTIAQPALDAGKKALGWIGNKALVPKTLDPRVKGTEEILRQEGAPGLTIGQLDPDPNTTRLASLFESVSYNSIFSHIGKSTRRLNEDAIQGAAQDIADLIRHTSSEEASKLFRWGVKDNWDSLVDAPATQIYNGIRRDAPGRIVEATPLLRLIQDKNSYLGNQAQAYLRKTREVPGAPKAEIDSLIDLLNTPEKGGAKALPKLTFDQAMRLKTALSQIANKPGTDQASKTAAANAGGLATRIDASIRKGLENAPDLLREYQSASEIYAAGIKSFRNETIQTLIKQITKTPGEFANAVLKPNQADVVEAYKEAVGPLWEQQFRPMLAGTVMSRAKQGSGDYSGSVLRNELQEGGKIGPVTGKAAFGDEGYSGLLKLADALEIVGAAPKGKLGVAVALRQGTFLGALGGSALGGVTALATGEMSSTISGASLGAGITVVVTPWAMGHLIGNPKLMDLFKRGLLSTAQEGKPSSLLMTAMRQIGAQQAATSTATELQPEQTPPKRAALPEIGRAVSLLQPEAS